MPILNNFAILNLDIEICLVKIFEISSKLANSRVRTSKTVSVSINVFGIQKMFFWHPKGFSLKHREGDESAGISSDTLPFLTV